MVGRLRIRHEPVKAGESWHHGAERRDAVSEDHRLGLGTGHSRP